MEERFLISNYLDIYGKLLTEKQYEIIDLYYNEDYSLLEISEHTGTSRQAVFDIIKRCNKTLNSYEEKLLFYKINKEKEEKIQYIIDNIKSEEINIIDRLKELI